LGSYFVWFGSEEAGWAGLSVCAGVPADIWGAAAAGLLRGEVSPNDPQEQFCLLL